MPWCGVFRGMVGLATPAAGDRKRRLGQSQRPRLVVVETGGDGRWWWGRVGSRLKRDSGSISHLIQMYAEFKFQAINAKMDAAEVQFTPLSELTASKQRYRVRVRVCIPLMWETFNPNHDDVGVSLEIFRSTTRDKPSKPIYITHTDKNVFQRGAS
ncbi:uncharacterized protein [Triticum aestivum]|uniref:uncharacterized protein n=1 Tax=Triticum aestivum TaxID=4565 RepID=UPI001D012C18|nr:uncharacterized protein LOC123068604 [Triticum aestivum]XP_044347153.1 uncharacterized protein LOC123068607 [Triticum aestivum]